MKLPERTRLLVLASVAGLILSACATSHEGMRRADTPKARQNAAEIHTELAHGLMQQGRLKEALERLQTAIEFNPDYAPARTMLGALYTRIKMMPEAEQQYRRAVQLKPKDGATNNNYAVFLCQEGKVSQAMPYFAKALADPFYQAPETAWTNSGICQIHAGDYQRAVADLEKALAIAPRYADALYHMAQARYRQGDAFHASAFIQRYMALGQPSAKALKLGYDIAVGLGNVEGAQEYARQLRRDFPDSKSALALDTQSKP